MEHSFGRALLGANQAGAFPSLGLVFRPWESSLFQVGMILLALGYTCCFCKSPRPAGHCEPFRGRVALARVPCVPPKFWSPYAGDAAKRGGLGPTIGH